MDKEINSLDRLQPYKTTKLPSHFPVSEGNMQFDAKGVSNLDSPNGKDVFVNFLAKSEHSSGVSDTFQIQNNTSLDASLRHQEMQEAKNTYLIMMDISKELRERFGEIKNMQGGG